MSSEAPVVFNGWTRRRGYSGKHGTDRGARRFDGDAAAVALALIAIANLANLTLADIMFRRVDFAIRAALGGSRSQIAAPEIGRA